MNEKSNNTKRSELYNKIFAVVSQLKLADTNGNDAVDHPSATHEIEQIFLKQEKTQNQNEQN